MKVKLRKDHQGRQTRTNTNGRPRKDQARTHKTKLPRRRRTKKRKAKERTTSKFKKQIPTRLEKTKQMQQKNADNTMFMVPGTCCCVFGLRTLVHLHGNFIVQNLENVDRVSCSDWL